MAIVGTATMVLMRVAERRYSATGVMRLSHNRNKGSDGRNIVGSPRGEEGESKQREEAEAEVVPAVIASMTSRIRLVV